MDVIRAPWRMNYIEDDTKPDGCIFCDYPKSDNDEESLIIYRGIECFVILNRYPYSNGHAMIVPYRHTSDFESLSDSESLEIMSLTRRTISALRAMMNPNGYNIGMNIGRSGGAGIDTHLHLHVVPRWNGDTNFMSVTAETKVLPEALSVTWKRMKESWK